MVIKAQSPAGFAEEYIIESIWNNRFPPGSILPAERELSELIGVTRTTLREVLQRLARDGWLTIQHGKPTKVNNFWETSGLNILETLARLDHESVPQLIDNLLSVRTNIATIFIRTAFRQHPEDALAVLASAREVEDHGDAFAELDYNIFRGLAFASGNPIYGLILNGMKGLYTRIGRHYFASPEARSLALGFYHRLAEICEQGLHDQVYETVRRYGHDSGEIWHRMHKTLPGDLSITGVKQSEAPPAEGLFAIRGYCCGQGSGPAATLPSSFCCSSSTSNPHSRCTCLSTSRRPLSSGARLCGI
jgi:GntR family negative regulator for fad regulon and positive regulator of fabA